MVDIFSINILNLAENDWVFDITKFKKLRKIAKLNF